MTFLVLLLTIGAYKLLGWHFRPEHDRWFVNFSERVSTTFGGSSRLTMLVSVLLPLLVVALVLSVVQDWVFGFVGLALQVLLLAYAFGRVNLPREVTTYLHHWCEGDFQSAYHHAQEYFKLEQGFDAGDRAQLHEKACRGVLYQWFEQVFVIVFWYLLLGPVAALFVRLLNLYEELGDQDETSRLVHVLEWLPARLLAITYAVAGNFTQCFKSWLTVLTEYRMTTEQVLFKSGLASIALGEKQLPTAEADVQAEQIQMLEALQIRCLVVCLILVALFTIF
ncbi:MAG: regulatory signaling modulator protein AmpE [Pseudomonadales bacterium]